MYFVYHVFFKKYHILKYYMLLCLYYILILVFHIFKLRIKQAIFLLLHLYRNDPFAYEMINSFELLYILKHLPAYLTYMDMDMD